MPQLEQISTFPSQIFWLVVTFVGLLIFLRLVALPKVTEELLKMMIAAPGGKWRRGAGR